SIHMFFVFYRITVIFLNSKKDVVDIKKNLKPFRLYIPKRKAKYVIEIPVDTNLLSLKLKDKIDWK
ncbi:MAG: DUF192 domain-containing protein, partial [Candidatus ainarchaeum sp.]|nr:DUF192 domain-containing protein [Candidatus ainarchaeum sp.]